jgi:hypothetical protein
MIQLFAEPADAGRSACRERHHRARRELRIARGVVPTADLQRHGCALRIDDFVDAIIFRS